MTSIAYANKIVSNLRDLAQKDSKLDVPVIGVPMTFECLKIELIRAFKAGYATCKNEISNDGVDVL